MGLNYITTSYGGLSPHEYLTSSRENFGPSDLADVLIHMLRGRWQDEFDPGKWLSDHPIKQLVETSFFASLTTEEGRTPRFSLFCGAHLHEAFDVLAFNPTKELNLHTLHHLAPICQRRDAAIRIAICEDAE